LAQARIRLKTEMAEAALRSSQQHQDAAALLDFADGKMERFEGLGAFDEGRELGPLSKVFEAEFERPLPISEMAKPTSIVRWGWIIADESMWPSILASRKAFGCASISVQERSPITPSRRRLRGRRLRPISTSAQEVSRCRAPKG
jgi:hypothetical protein